MGFTRFQLYVIPCIVMYCIFSVIDAKNNEGTLWHPIAAIVLSGISYFIFLYNKIEKADHKNCCNACKKARTENDKFRETIEQLKV